MATPKSTPRAIWPHMKKFSEWLPGEIPDRVARELASFTPHRDGWVRWYSGRTAFVCGKRTPLEEVGDRWRAKRDELDAANAAVTAGTPESRGTTFADFASLFYVHNDQRVRTGKPKRMSAVTAWDYKRTVNGFGACIGPDTLIDDLAPLHFLKYVDEIRDFPASTWNRHVAYIEAMIRWGLDRGMFAGNARLKTIAVGQDPLRHIIGPDLVKLPGEDLRDERVVKEKSYAPSELRALWDAADDEEKVWIGLGLNAAFDNADLAHLPRVVVNVKGKQLDFRRRKRGKVRRVAPIVPALLPLLESYERPATSDAELDELFFLTPTGQKLQRLTDGGQVDYVAMKWTRLMQRAGLRPKPIVTRDPETGKRKMVYPDRAGKADGRGFRSLRTTFANLAPPGYREEVEIVMGHAQGEVQLDHYIEKHGFARLEYLTRHVWHRAFA